MLSQSAAADQVSKDTLSSAADNLLPRLHNALQRLVDLGDRLHGPSPRPAQTQGTQPVPPSPAIKRYIDDAHRLITDISGELDRIESRL